MSGFENCEQYLSESDIEDFITDVAAASTDFGINSGPLLNTFPVQHASEKAGYDNTLTARKCGGHLLDISYGNFDGRLKENI